MNNMYLLFAGLDNRRAISGIGITGGWDDCIGHYRSEDEAYAGFARYLAAATKTITWGNIILIENNSLRLIARYSVESGMLEDVTY